MPLLRKCFWIVLLLLAGCAKSGERPLAKDGVLDLRGRSMNESPALDMAGDWDFYWEQLLTPDSIDATAARKMPMPVPRIWSQGNETLPVLGYATYRLQVLLDKPEPLALYFPPSIWSSSRIFVDGILVAEFGLVGTNEQSSKGGLGQKTYSFIPDSDHLDIVVQVANFEIFLAGITIAPKIGSLAAVLHAQEQPRLINMLLVGMLLIMGLYNFCLFMLRTKDKSTLWFGWLCIFTAIWSAFARSGVIFASFPEIDFDLRMKIFNMAWILGTACFSWFMHHTFKQHFSRWMGLSISASSVICSIIIVFSSAKVFVPVANAYQVVVAFASLYAVQGIVRACRARVSDSYVFMSGVFIPVSTVIVDIISSRGYLDLPPLTGFGLGAFIFCQSYLIARRFSRAFDQAEHLSENLQKEVKNQTGKLEIQRDKLIEQKKEIIQAHEELQHRDEQKTRFFQNISHELRTPLTLILGSLAQAEKEGQESKPIQVAARNSKRLLRLVNQLLDFQKLAAGQGELTLKKLDLESFLTSISQYIQPTCEQRGIHFEIQLPAGNGHRPMVSAHVDALEKIVFNYLSNSLKFTPKGGEIRLILSTTGHMARIRVEDTAGGIPKAKLGQLFKVFSQLDDSTKREFEGTGLGLALAKELATRMQGSVGVESEEGKGSAFWVDLALCHDESHTLDLLVIEGNANLRRQLEDELMQRQVCDSYRVVGTSEEAHTILGRYRVHCVLIDAQLPEEKGLALLAQVAEEQPHAKRLLLTDRAQSHRIVQKAINTAKIDRIFYRPFSGELFSVVKTLVDEAKIQHSGRILDVLVIDDEDSILRSIQLMLIDSDSIQTFELVSDVEKAKQIMRLRRIRCVLVDANLTAADGTDFLMEIAALQPDCHRILITGESDPEILEKAINKARVDQVMYKPLHKADLLKRVEDAIRQSPIMDLSVDDEDQSSEYQPKDWLLADVQSPVQASAGSLETLSVPSREERILVVDDVDDMRDLIQSVLRRQGYQVEGACHGEEALEKLQSNPYDLVVSDWMMPRKSGPELLGDMHKDPRLAGIPTILLTAKGDDVSKVVAAQEGASAYLAKPFDEAELQSTVVNLLKLKEGERTIAALNRDLTENILKRFLPPHLVNEIALGHWEFINEARLSAVTIVFADLCQFTRTSEELGPRKIAKVLNQFLDVMTEVVFQAGGTIDKFIGDAVMVIFGAPLAMPAGEQVEKACRCAIDMQEALARLNQTLMDQDLPSFEMRVGIHHGAATVGMFGGPRRSDYTVIGPTVNLASRVESAAAPGEILMTAVVRDYLKGDNWEKAGNYDIKGVGDGITLYRLKEEQKKAA